MPHSSTATAAALRTALEAVANARPQFGAGLAALILALLARLLGRAEAAWDLSPHLTDEDEAEHDPDFVYVIPFVGRAIHAICVEAGLVPGWIFAGPPCRGMRALPAPTPHCIARRKPAHRHDSIPPQAQNPLAFEGVDSCLFILGFTYLLNEVWVRAPGLVV